MEFGTRAEIEAAATGGSAIVIPPKAVHTVGGEEAGDGGSAYYALVSTEPAHQGKLEFAGEWGELIDPPTPLNTGVSDLATLRAIEQATGRVVHVRHFVDFFTVTQKLAMLSDDWAGIDMDDFRTRTQAAFDAADGCELLLPPCAWIKLNGPVLFDNGQTIRAPASGGEYSRGLKIYADLSVDWRTACHAAPSWRAAISAFRPHILPGDPSPTIAATCCLRISR